MNDFVAMDKRHIWHPYTQHLTERDPVIITKAKGTSLYDEDGNEILDMISSWWTCIHGHSHPALNKALSDQASVMPHVMFAGFSHPPAIHLAKKLSALLPEDLNRVFYSDNGSTAVEVALKIAYQYWKNKGEVTRHKFLAFDLGYHGDTVGAMSVGKGCGFFKNFEDICFQVDMIPYVETWAGDDDVVAKEEAALIEIKNIMDRQKGEIAALIMEPLMQGAGGVRFSRPEFIKAVTELAHENNILVIFDEVAVGFGRTGKMFACEKIGVTPDIICLSKGLTAGYMPMAVTVATDRLFNEFLDEGFEKAFIHGHTFTANPLACAVALKSLELFEEENTLEKIVHIEARHKEQLKKLQDHPLIFKARVMGTALAFNLSENKAGYKTGGGEFLRDWYFTNGLNIRPLGDAVYLMPPYCITDEELTRAYAGLFAGLSSLPKSVS